MRGSWFSDRSDFIQFCSFKQYILWFIQFGLQHNWTDMQTWSVLSFKHETSLCAVIPTVWNRALLGLPFSIHVQYIYIYIYLYLYDMCVHIHIYIYDMCVCMYIYIYRYVTNGFPELFFFCVCVCVSGSRFFLPTSRSFASLSNGTDYLLNKCSWFMKRGWS